MKKILMIVLIAALILGAFVVGYLAKGEPVAQETFSEPSASGTLQDMTLASQDNSTGTIEEASVKEAAEVADVPVAAAHTAEVETSGITLEQAKQIALDDAGVSEGDTSWLNGRLDYDDGRKIYEVEFFVENTEYDYDILADSGEILERNYETHTTTKILPSRADYIGVDQAKENAAGHAGVAVSDATFTKAKLEQDDGREVYEIEFFAGGREYEYVIDPHTGEILEAEFD